MINQLAPTLGGEWKVTLALIDPAEATPASGLPDLAGEYIELGCTKEIRCKLPFQKTKPIACKLNPARWMVPGMGVLGELSIGNLDFADSEDDILSFGGQRCVAKLELIRVGVDHTIRTIYAIDWTPEIEIVAPEGEGETSVTASGPFARHQIDIGS